MTDFHSSPMLGIIGGSGLYEIDGLENVGWQRLETPWGEASDKLLLGSLDGIPMAFLPRHGRGHRLSPTKINYRANIDVMKRAGVTDIISLSAVGSLREDLEPGTFVIVDQFIDRTFAREKSFFDNGLVSHVSMAHPTNARLGGWCEEVCISENIAYQRGGTYLVMEGPQFSTLAESNIYRQWGCAVIGMTNMPEAKLAREAEIPYCTVAMVTDFDCWHPDHDNVQVETVVRVLSENAENARKLVKGVTPKMKNRPSICPSGDDRVLDQALITAPAARNPTAFKKLGSIANRILDK